MSRTERRLAAHGAPNNIFTRTIFRIVYPAATIGVTTYAFVTRKTRLEVAQRMLARLED